MTQAFASIRVIDASNNISGQYAARLLADFGADVVLAEPHEGTPTRWAPPRTASASFLFEHVNAGKRSVRVADDEELAALARHADVVIVGDTEQAERLHRDGTPAVIATVTEFSPTGPYAEWRGSELIHQALSGSMSYTGLAGREPLFGVGHRAEYAAGTQLYIGIVAALYQRVTTGCAPRRVAVSVHEAAAAMEQNFSTQYAYNGTIARRGERKRPRGYARCRDGWVVYHALIGQWPAFCEAFQAPDLIADPRFAAWNDMVTNWHAAVAELHERGRDLTTTEVFEAARERNLALAPMLSLSALIDEPHLRGRDFWNEVDGSVPVALGPLFRPGVSTWDRSRSAPGLGAGGPAVVSEDHRASVPEIATTPPLAGIRILDMTHAWAGPMATRVLASLGADIIKIEGPNRPDTWRGEAKDPPTLHTYPDQDGGARPFDRHCWFNSQNQDKRSVVLDIKNDVGLDLARRIVEQTDVIVANWSPGALDRTGIGYADARRLNDGIIVVEMSAISSTGPLSQLRGLGPTMEAMSGIGALIGYPDDRPIGSGSAYLDPTGGLNGAAAVLTALYQRAISGDGQWVEVAQREAAMQWIGELLLDTILTGAQYRASGNRSDVAAPHGAYPALGDDEWIAIDVRTDAEWTAFCEVAQVDPALVADFSTVADRLANVEQVDAIVAKHVASADKYELAARLQAVGVRAAPVQTGKDLFVDPHLRHSGWFTALDHPHVGVKEYPGLPLEIDGRRSKPASAAPCFGQHTFEVLHELLGITPEEFDTLTASGVTADRPKGQRGG